MQKPREWKYDNKTKNWLMSRVCKYNAEELIVADYNEAIKRNMLISEWAMAGIQGRNELRQHLDTCIRLVEFKIKLIHDTMRVRGIDVWLEEENKNIDCEEGDNEEIN